MNVKTAPNFFNLDPGLVLNVTEQAGFIPTGEFLQLNSYENRVFDISLEFDDPKLARESHIISKFYRPGRWSVQTILEEHDFLRDLSHEGIPAVAPLKQKNQSTLNQIEGISFAFFPKVLGRMPQEFQKNDLLQMGRLLAQVHNMGARKKAPHRMALGNSKFCLEALQLLEDWVAPEIANRYFEAAENIIDFLEAHLDQREFIRIHGDCHKGNLLHNGSSYFLVDFDDFCNGPVVQDFWMLLSGDESSLQEERDFLLEGYEELRPFPIHQWSLIPALRGLRIISYAAWIAKRWDDPSFPRLFPEYNTYRYWAEETESLERIAWSL
jgi:Ser/Thr protein kinase RdoA (MazF antagonist)